MTTQIHSTALVDSTAELGDNVVVGPFAIVGPGVALGDGSEIEPRVTLERNCTLGRGCFVGTGSAIGTPPQDRKYGGETTWVHIGEETVIREYVTVNRGTATRGETRIGCRCFLMTYVHVAHDCVIEDDVELANSVQLGGHVHIASGASVGGATAIHQFVRIGTRAFVGGGSRVSQDVPPFAKAAGNPMKLYGTNAVGLSRAGLESDVRLALRHAYRMLFNSDLTTSEAITYLRAGSSQVPEVMRLVDFVSQSERGVLV